MAANISPIFPLAPVITWAYALGNTVAYTANQDLSSANSTNSFTIYTAGANGSRLDFARIRSVQNTSTVASVGRFWINNGSVTTVANNSALFMERTIPATTASQVAEQGDIIVPLNVSVPAGYKLYFTCGTAPVATGANGGWIVTAVGGDY